MRKIAIIIFSALFLFSVTCSAHPGRTDKYGGHINKATGEYHYHNSDGSVTPEQKPEATSEDPETKTVTESTESEVKSIIVDNESKPVTKNVSDIIKEEQQPKPAEADKITITTDENGKSVIYIPNSSAYGKLGIFALYLLIILAVFGFLALSPLIYQLLRKIEEKNKAWGIILHVPYLIFWLPSIPGRLLYKLYNLISPEDTKDEDDYEEDDYYVDI